MDTLAIIVNYKSTDLALKAVRSVLDSQSLGPVEIVVVDNSEDDEEAQNLRRGLPAHAHLLVSPGNIGFGRACNLALEGFRGDAILLLNPDARLLPGCLKRLQETLFSWEKIAGVSPQIYWDDELFFLLPPSCPPAFFELQQVLDVLYPIGRARRLFSILWRRHAMRVWRSQRPVFVSNLTGGLVLLKRNAVQEVGGLFDPQFFLYFEDTDLFVRLRKAKYMLAIEPKARAIHYYDQCGKDAKEKRRRMDESLSIFIKKHRFWWSCYSRQIIRNGFALLGGRKGAGSSGINLYHAPFELEIPLPMHRGWLFEWSPNPSLVPSAGKWGKGPVLKFSNRWWDHLAPGRYFGRLGRAKRLESHFVEFSWHVAD